MTVKRYAIVGGARSRQQVEAYLPPYYGVIHEGEQDGHPIYVIAGRDEAGWTLDKYVLPRLASGLIIGKEIDLSHPIMREVPTDA